MPTSTRRACSRNTTRRTHARNAHCGGPPRNFSKNNSSDAKKLLSANFSARDFSHEGTRAQNTKRLYSCGFRDHARNAMPQKSRGDANFARPRTFTKQKPSRCFLHLDADEASRTKRRLSTLQHINRKESKMAKIVKAKKKPAARKPVARKVAAKKPAARKVAKKPVARKAAKKPVARKAAAKRVTRKVVRKSK
jgi:hypothetical protein